MPIPRSTLSPWLVTDVHLLSALECCTLCVKPTFHCDAKTLPLAKTPNAKFRLVSKNVKICVTPNANAKICVTPNVKPQRESVEYRFCWGLGLVLGMYVSCCLCQFCLSLVANANTVFSGIWALDLYHSVSLTAPTCSTINLI